MRNFNEILNGIPDIVRFLWTFVFVVFVMYLISLCIRYIRTENGSYRKKVKNTVFLLLFIIVVESLISYVEIVHSGINITGVERICKNNYPSTDSIVKNDESSSISSSQGENEVVIFANDEFFIEDSDHLAIADIMSGEISLQEVDEISNDIWYQYILIPASSNDETIAVGSYHNTIVTSLCLDLGWNITSKGKGGS